MLSRLFSITCALSLMMLLICVGVWVWAAAAGGWRRTYFLTNSNLAAEVGITRDHAWVTTMTWMGTPPPERWVSASPLPGSHHWEIAGLWYDWESANVFSPDASRSYRGGLHNYGMMMWTPTVLFSLLPLAWAVFVWRPRLIRKRRIRRGLCPACGYDLRASAERCPECGAVTV